MSNSHERSRTTTAEPDFARNYVGGWTEPNGEVEPVVNPATGESIATVA